MARFKELTTGCILSETQYYIVEKVKGNQVQLNTGNGSVVLDKGYVESYLNSASQFTSEEKLTKTQLAELFISKPRIAMTVAFFKQDKKKTQKAYKEEVEAQAEQVQKDFLANGISAINNALKNPISMIIPGELRVMKGRHYGDIDDLGRIKFTDMEVPKTDGHHRTLRQVDPRTIQYIIVEDVKYILKK